MYYYLYKHWQLSKSANEITRFYSGKRLTGSTSNAAAFAGAPNGYRQHFPRAGHFVSFKEHIVWQQPPTKIGHVCLFESIIYTILETLVYLFWGCSINYQTELQDFWRIHADWPPWFWSWLFHDFVGVRHAHVLSSPRFQSDVMLPNEVICLGAVPQPLSSHWNSLQLCGFWTFSFLLVGILHLCISQPFPRFSEYGQRNLSMTVGSKATSYFLVNFLVFVTS